jgi:hypothetical protein
MIGQGYLLRLRRDSDQSQPLEKQPYLPGSIDLLCVNTDVVALTGAVAGSDVVQLDLAHFVAGRLPNIVKALTGGLMPILGVVHWQAGSVAVGASCWVRIVGVHPYAKVEGTAAVAIGNPLKIHATAGAFQLGTAEHVPYGWAREAQAVAAVVAASVLLSDPAHVVKF